MRSAGEDGSPTEVLIKSSEQRVKECLVRPTVAELGEVFDRAPSEGMLEFAA